jgi:hypothetical protein
MTRTVNDHVEAIHLGLIENAKYVAFLNAVDDEQAIEGTLMADGIMAALMIRKKAEELKIDAISNENLADIRTALRVVLRRYDVSRGGSS